MPGMRGGGVVTQKMTPIPISPGRAAALVWGGCMGGLQNPSTSGLQDPSRNHCPHLDLADWGPEHGGSSPKVA